MTWLERLAQKKDQFAIDAQEWYDNLDDNGKSQVMEGYNKMMMFFNRTGLGRKITYEEFIRKNYKVMQNIENGKHQKAFKALDKAGKVILHEKESK
jgi:hypothetical protein